MHKFPILSICQGECVCKSNFVGLKCDKCAPERYNYPRCEECNCDPAGVTDDFFAKGGCDSVPEGTLCTCKEHVTGRICDKCKPLYWNLQSRYEQQTVLVQIRTCLGLPYVCTRFEDGCEECSCERNGTIGRLGICDLVDGQCACKPHVGGSSDRTCSVCKVGATKKSTN